MRWHYTEFSDQSIETVLRQAADYLNNLTAAEANTAKVEASDQYGGFSPIHIGGGSSRSLVVWSEAETQPSPAELPATWKSYTWTTDHDYQTMYDGLVSALNNGITPGGDHISPTAAYWSRICMSNMARGEATLTLFWRG